MKIWQWHVVIYVVFTSLQSCNGLKYMDLYFTSNNCDEDARKVSESKAYNLTWYGQIKPKLCSFKFSGQVRNRYEICFESLVYNIYNLRDVQVKVKNNTKSSWTFDRHDNKIGRTCVKWGYKLNISIVVPTGYREPSSDIYIHLQITANILEDDGLSLWSIILGATFGVIFLGCVIVSCAKDSSGSARSFIGELCGSLCGILKYCLECKCVRHCDRPSCDCDSPSLPTDCDCNNICRPCGECCSAWAGCCSAILVRQPESSTQNTSSTPTSSHTETSNTSAYLQNTSHSSASVPDEPPPSYQSVKDMSSNSVPDAPPPCYDDVVIQKYMRQTSV